MKKIFFILPILVMSVWLSAQTSFTATYTFSGTTGHVQSFTYNGTTYAGISMGTIDKVGVTSSSSTNNFRATDWPLGATNGNDVFTGTVDLGKYIGFTINAVTGYKFTVSTITFGIGRSGTGTRQCQWRGSYDNYGSIINNYTTLHASLSNSNGILTNPDDNLSWTGNVLTLDSNYANITTSCGFRLYMYNAEQIAGTAGLQGPLTITGTFEPTGLTPNITVNPSTLTGFSYVTGSGPSSEQSFSLTGSNLTSDLTVSISTDKHFEISSTSGVNFGNSLSYTPSDGSVSATVYVRMKAGLAPGDYNNENIVCSSEGATSQNVTCSGTVYKPEPANHVTNFSCSSASVSSLTLTWSDASKYSPDGYLIKGSAVSFDDITAPVDGTPESDAALIKNVAQGTQTCTFSSLSENTTYYFKIYPYTNSGSAINYKTDGTVPQVSASTLENYHLTQGDIAILAFQSDNMDQFAFILLTNIPAGTEVYFTDKGWTGTAFATNEQGVLTWTVPAGGLTKGTIIKATANDANSSGWTLEPDNSGTISTSGAVQFAAAGDQIFVFQGSVTNPTFIYGMSSTTWISTGPTSSNTSYLPDVLINGSTAFAFPQSDTGPWDNGYYNIETITGTKEAILNSIATAENWTFSETRFDSLPEWQYQEEQPPLPVVLTSFTAIISADNCIILNWTTESENGLVGYYIYRSTNDKLENAQLISQMITANNSSSQCIYTYEDNEVFDTTTYYYWLQSIELGGIANIYGPVSVYYGPLNGYPTPEVPFETVLQPIYPNPFNPIVFIPYTLAEATDLNFYIYNSRGQLIRHFYVGTQEPGYYRLSWDGKDSKGISCANGVYQIVMKAGKNVYTRKAALMK